MTPQPRVSVVIPTIGRPTLERAVTSALKQTIADIEIIVCDNGRTPLPVLESDRVRIIRLTPGAGGNAARQTGIEAAAAPLVALLDDDDHWRPDHLAALLDLTGATTGDQWIASSVGHLEGGTPFPSRPAQSHEGPLDYCFRARSFRFKGAMPTSGLLFPTVLARRIPWRNEVRFHQDLTWIVEVCASTDCQLVTTNVVTFDFGDTANSVSKSIAIDDSLAWARGVLLPTAGRRLFADFLLTRYPMRSAAARSDVREVARIFWEAVRNGNPSVQATLYALIQTVRPLLRRRR